MQGCSIAARGESIAWFVDPLPISGSISRLMIVGW
jgi:hypothetical protein